MVLVVMASLKASPGVTTAALALAASWPGDARAVVAECDPAGGVLAARYGLPASPGMVTLAAASRRERDPGLIWRHARRLPGGLETVAAPPGAGQARAALALLARDGAAVLRGAADAGAAVVADCGRLDPGSAAWPLLAAADLTLLLARPAADELAVVASGAAAIAQASRAAALILAGTGPYPPAEIAAAAGLAVVAVLPADARAARALAGYPLPARRLAHRPLLLAAAGLARQVTAVLPPARAPRPPGPARGHPVPAGPVPGRGPAPGGSTP